MAESITPPPELIGRWEEDWHHSKVKHIELEDHIANEAAQWGADQELEACCKWTAIVGGADALRAARRPKPPSLKEQAMAALREACEMANDRPPEGISNDQIDIIRCALEALDD
jgi:hypothetical protein